MSLHQGEGWKHPSQLPPPLLPVHASALHLPLPQLQLSSSAAAASKASKSSHKEHKDKSKKDKRLDSAHKRTMSTHSNGGPSATASPPSPSTPPSPPSPPLPPARTDLTSRHSTLNSLLASNSSHYWQTIELFLRAQLSKVELDAEVTRLLGDAVWAHNDFFFALLQNAMSDELPKMGDNALGLKREGELGGLVKLDGKVKDESAKEGRDEREAREKREKEQSKALVKDGKKGKDDKSKKDIKVEDAKDKGKKLKGKDGTVKGGELKKEKKGKRGAGGRLSDDEDDTMDWTEQAWPQPPVPTRLSALPPATLHREMKHVTSAADYFALLKQIGRRKAWARGDGGMDEKEDWQYALDEGERGYLRIRDDDEPDDTAAASLQGALSIIRRKRKQREEDAGIGRSPSVASDEKKDAAEDAALSAWLNPASSLAFLSSAPSLPSLSSLRARCQLLARHGGLKSISESALQLVYTAMERYVQRVVTELVAEQRALAEDAAARTRDAKVKQEEKEDDAMLIDEGTPAPSSSPSTAPMAVDSLLSSAPPASSSSSSASFSSFPASCFAPSIFSARPVLEGADDLPALIPADAFSSSPDAQSSSLCATAATTVSSASRQPAELNMGTQAGAPSAPVAATAARSPAPAAAITDGRVVPPPATSGPRPALSVSVPVSPPSARPSSIASPTPLTQLAQSSASSSGSAPPPAPSSPTPPVELGFFPFLIAHPPAYRPADHSRADEEQKEQEQLAMQQRSQLPASDSRSHASGSSLLSLADLLRTLSAESSRIPSSVRLVEDLPLLLERLLIVA